MRILQVSSARSFGGGEKHLVDLVRGLSARGHKVFLAAAPDSPLRSELGGYADFIPVKISHALDLGAASRLSKIIRSENIDIVHAHMARDYVPASLAVRFDKSVKLVLTRHVLFPMKSLHKLALSNVSRVIAVSGAVEKQLSKQGIFAPSKIVTINNGIDVRHWANSPHAEIRRSFRNEHGISDEELVIGYIGELKKLKGQEDLILAAEIILQKFPNTRFVIAGKDNAKDGEYCHHLRGLASAIGAEKNFVWIDWVDDTAPLLHALDVFVSPSHSESFGLAILEAMASGCAVVSTATEGAAGLLDHDALVPIGDAVRIAEAVCNLLADADARNEKGSRNQSIAIKRFDVERMIDATEKLYLELESAV